jgi:thiamine pyrophosphate-dependent acetolactate synthase large subunit-like protein
MLILNNRSYGMVRQFQQSYFNDRYQSCGLSSNVNTHSHPK